MTRLTYTRHIEQRITPTVSVIHPHSDVYGDTPAHIVLRTPEAVAAARDLAHWSRDTGLPLPYAPITIAALESAGFSVDLHRSTIDAGDGSDYATPATIAALAPYIALNPEWIAYRQAQLFGDPPPQPALQPAPQPLQVP